MSIIKHKEQRVGIFIDAQNIYHTAKNLYGRRVNFGEVVKSALADRKLVRAIAYVITSEEGDEDAFFDALTKVGIETKTKDLQVFSSGAKKADWDVGLAVDAIKLAIAKALTVGFTDLRSTLKKAEFLKRDSREKERKKYGLRSARKREQFSKR
jgi:uncharacterized LabA/DUF88 family protein